MLSADEQAALCFTLADALLGIETNGTNRLIRLLSRFTLADALLGIETKARKSLAGMYFPFHFG